MLSASAGVAQLPPIESAQRRTLPQGAQPGHSAGSTVLSVRFDRDKPSNRMTPSGYRYGFPLDNPLKQLGKTGFCFEGADRVRVVHGNQLVCTAGLVS